MNDTLITVLLPIAASFVTGTATFLATRRYKDHDFIMSLQASINTLSASYNVSIQELCELKRTNMELTIKIKELENENRLLLEKIDFITYRLDGGRLPDSPDADPGCGTAGR